MLLIILEVDRTVTSQKWEVLEGLKYSLQIDIQVDWKGKMIGYWKGNSSGQ